MQSKIKKHSAALLATSEIAIGSILHGLKIPFAGHLLSINQGLILTWASKNLGRSNAILEVTSTSHIAAILKSLSPAGKKLTPMLAIAMQGWFYTFGILIGGVNPLGISLAMIFLVLWGFIQPILLATIFYGFDFFPTLIKMANEFSSHFNIPKELIWYLFFGVIFLKIIIAIIVGLFAYLGPNIWFEKYQNKLSGLKKNSIKPQNKSTFKGALFDLLHPFFLTSYAFSILFFIYFDDPNAKNIWIYLLRPVAIAYVVFWFFRFLPSYVGPWAKKNTPTIYQQAKTIFEQIAPGEVQPQHLEQSHKDHSHQDLNQLENEDRQS